MSAGNNIAKMIAISDGSWDAAIARGLAGLTVRHAPGGRLTNSAGESFVNMCSCSYLGLDTHPAILDGAIEGIRRAGTLHLTTARTRIALSLLEEAEYALSSHFGADAMVFVSCAQATSTFLPVCAAGVFTGGVKPVMIFDRQAHFSMNHVKPICAGEAEVVTSEHNDISYVEARCKEGGRPVVYVADATYSIEGAAPLAELSRLQERYGLFLFLDDSHGLSVTGTLGKGAAMEYFDVLPERTVVAASLAKAFGACGGALFSGSSKVKATLTRHGSPWSQYLNSAGLGAVLASLELHGSDELSDRQRRWRENLAIVDDSFESLNRHTLSPIRVVFLDTQDGTLNVAESMLRRGYYTSAVFFPIVAKDKVGLRIMPRADLTSVQVRDFCAALASLNSTERGGVK